MQFDLHYTAEEWKNISIFTEKIIMAVKVLINYLIITSNNFRLLIRGI